MKTKHTDSPWEAVPQMPTGYTIENEQGQLIAVTQCDEEYNKENPVTQAEEVVNAELIASAPELLRMVYDLMKAITDDSHANDAERLATEAHALLHRINPEYNQ